MNKLKSPVGFQDQLLDTLNDIAQKHGISPSGGARKFIRRAPIPNIAVLMKGSTFELGVYEPITRELAVTLARAIGQKVPFGTKDKIIVLLQKAQYAVDEKLTELVETGQLFQNAKDEWHVKELEEPS